MQIITFESDLDEYQHSLLKYTCEVNGIPLEVIGLGVEWVGTRQKIFGYLDYLKGLAADEVVICCDNRDVIIPSKPEEIVSKFKEMGGGCYFSAELGGFPIWVMEKHFDHPDNNRYRPQVRVLNSGVCIGEAGTLVEVFSYALQRFYDKSFDMEQYLTSQYQISKSDIEDATKQYPSRLNPEGLTGPLQCDQLVMQLTYLETDLIELDYDYELIYTSSILPDKWMPTKEYREKNLPDYPYGSLYDIQFNWGETYRTVYNTYSNTYPLIYHTPGKDYVMSQLRKVVKGYFPKNQMLEQFAVPSNDESQLESGFGKFIDGNTDKNFFVCWKNKNVQSLIDIFDQCVKRDKTLVVMCPKFKDYPQDLKYMIVERSANVRIYEVGEYAMNSYLRTRGSDFVRQFDDAITIPESLFLNV